MEDDLFIYVFASGKNPLGYGLFSVDVGLWFFFMHKTRQNSLN